MTPPAPIVLLVDVDNTLLDNDHIQGDIRKYLQREYGPACRDRYWAILERFMGKLGYFDYLGALQRYRVWIRPTLHCSQYRRSLSTIRSRTASVRARSTCSSVFGARG